MADSKVTIKIDADAEGAKRAFAEVQSSADAAMESGARSAQKLSKSLDGVADSATISAKQIKAIAVGLAGVATGLAATALANSGNEAAAGYLKSGVGGALGGLTQGLAFGNRKSALLGAIGGGITGLAQYYMERKERGEEQKEGVGDTVESLAKAREEMDRVAERTDNFEKLLKTLGDTTADAASREKLLADEIEKRKQGEDGAREKMKAAEAAMKSFQGTLDGPMTREQEKYFQTLQEDWKNAAKELQTNRAERKTLEGQKVEKDKPNYDQSGTDNERLGSILSGMEKAGIGFAALETNAIADKHAKGWGFRTGDVEGVGSVAEAVNDATNDAADKFSAAVDAFATATEETDDGTKNAVEEGNEISEKQLAVLERIESKTTGTAVFA